MASLKDRLTAAFDRRRKAWPWLDHLVRVQQHYSAVNGSANAGAVTYFAFLSFFPVLALAFFVVGYVGRVYPDAQGNLVSAISKVLPGMIGTGNGQIKLKDIEDAAGAVGLIGVVTLLYSGLGWLSGLRTALEVVFEVSRSQQPSFVIGKLRDLVTLAAVGATLVLSVAVTGAVAGFSTKLLDLVGLGDQLLWLVHLLGPLLGLVTSTLMFFVMFRLLADPPTPVRSLWSGAVFGAVGFEILKQASSYLLQSTKHQPAFQAFGIALILVVWINYFSRLVLYAAAWAHTSRAARAAAAEQAERAPRERELVLPQHGAAAAAPAGRRTPDPRLAFGAGAAAMLALVAAARRAGRRSG